MRNATFGRRNGRPLLLSLLLGGLGATAAPADSEAPADRPPQFRAGMIGLDTSHVGAFSEVLNDPNAKPDVAGCPVVAAYPKGTRDIPSGLERVDSYTSQLREMGVEIVDSIDALIERVDVVLLMTVDGRPHLEQAIPVLRARKPMFIDKPFAGSLVDAIAIVELAKHYSAPFFSSSSLRYSENAQLVARGEIGDVLGADVYSPCPIEPHHPDLFWYGIHGVEMLYTVMGSGCRTVARAHTEGADLVTGVWAGDRIGTFRGLRAGAHDYGGTAFGTKGIHPTGPYSGYRPLVVEIVKFFRTGQPPIAPEETLEIFAFMETADESKRRGGIPVALEAVLEEARKEARRIVEAILAGEWEPAPDPRETKE